tara:strand:+ start:2409 stop:4271 length:1863 start_codon:yes stop_codon:yes gene_type:complete
VKQLYYDIVVVGAGHAGVESATMCSRLGAKTALITFKESDIGTLSCNPAMGGLGKGHLIREIDAMGGIIGKASDLSGIQFRMLNKTRGAAVQGPRAQIDRQQYSLNVKKLIKKENIDLIYDEVIDILLEKNKSSKKIRGIELRNIGKLLCKSLIVTTGTFLRGKIHQGNKNWPAGRMNSDPSIKLANFFKNQKFRIIRLKTGTPPRLVGASINYDDCIIQEGDSRPEPFSFLTTNFKKKQVPCFITHTNKKTHEIIRKNLKNSPIFDGSIKSNGPRYCPSVEDKIYRFQDKESHQIFLEPETISGEVVYPNGISTSLPTSTQKSFLQTINGLEHVKIQQYGYSIEYDCIDSAEIDQTFQSKKIQGLYLAGQINGTTGYEEAAAQGLLSGINASLSLKNQKSFIIPRSLGYLGVLSSDLIKGGLIEPYRMFTSRAEYRILLRADNADERLTDLAIKIGTAEKERKNDWLNKRKLIKKANKLLNELKASPQVYAKFGIKINQDGKKRTAYDVLGYQETSWRKLQAIWPELAKLNLNTTIKKQIKSNSFYNRYSNRQELEIRELEKDKSLKIREDVNYQKCSGLSNEAKEVLEANRPNNIQEARLLPGMTPAAANILLRFVKK